MYVSLAKMETTLTSSLKQKGKTSTNLFLIKNLMKLLKKPLEKSANVLLEYIYAFYKVGLRPLFGNACQFQPTCSNYSHQAFLDHGFVKGLALTTWRLLRCQPFCSGGYDPVPPKQEVLNG